MTAPRPAPPHDRSARGGFVFLDLVVGAALLAVALLAAAQLVLDSNNLEQCLTTKRIVSDRISDELKRVEITPFDDVVTQHSGRAFAVAETGGLRLSAPPGDADGLPGKITVKVPTPPGRADQLLEVEVAVEWQDRTGFRSLSRSMYLSRVGGAR